MDNLKELSVFELLHKLINAENDEISESEYIKIVAELENKAGQHFGNNVDKWVKWYCSSDSGYSDAQKEAIKTIKRLMDAEKKYIPKIKQKTDGHEKQ